MLKIIILIVFFLTNTAYAQQHFDRAVFAIQNSNYDCDGLINAIKDVKDFRYSWLYKSFDNLEAGKNISCVNKLNRLKQTTLMQVHLINEPCARNNNCANHEFLHKTSVKKYQDGLINSDTTLIKNLEKYISDSANIILPSLNDNIKCLVSPGLESNLNHKAAKNLIEITKRYYGKRCEIVWNPVNQSKFSDKIFGTIHELHGPINKLKEPCVANLDGVDINFSDRKSYIEGKAISEAEVLKYLESNKHCLASFIWIAEDNCLERKEREPRLRKNCTSKQRQAKLRSLFYQ